MKGNQFKPAWWLNNSHLQTIWPAICRSGVKNIEVERERLELPDGDFIDLDWVGKNRAGPIVVILHGFEGSLNSHYAKSMLQKISMQGWRGIFMNFRGCSGEPNRLPRGYHSGETSDIAYVMSVLRNREPTAALAAIGYSLGGNILLKWLGETGQSNPLKAAIAISVPFELHKAAERIQRGFSRLYQWYLLKCARERLLHKYEKMHGSCDPTYLMDVQNIRDFDDKYTVPLHGFSSVDHYYSITSSRRYMRAITIPTLVVHAKDDPFMTEDVIPSPDEISSYVKLEVTERGGHVGFVSGKYPWCPEYWLESRIPAFLQEHIR